VRVLLADDSPEFVSSALRRLQSDASVEVVACASSGREAVRLTSTLGPDLVLMDLAMPEMNGLEATRRIKALAHPPRVLILTLYDDPAYRDAAREAGADGFVSKAEWNREMPSALRSLFGPLGGDGEPGGPHAGAG
jgi:DNA-binding NarL/FixJ family response regulator